MLITKSALLAALASPILHWTASTPIVAYTRFILPTGGVGYCTAARTTRSSWDASERGLWTFVPSGHQEQITSGTTWVAPTGIVNLLSLDLLGGGAGGGGGGSATTAINQVGGPGGAPGERTVRRNLTVVPTTSYTCAVGAGGSGGSGGAASGNNPGVVGVLGGATTFTIGGVTYQAKGGNIGNAPASGTAAAQAGTAGGTTGAWVSQFGIPGTGGIGFSTVGLPPYPLGGVIGGAGGGPASSGTSKGGLGGGAKTTPNGDVASTGAGGSGTASGGNGTTATELGCGGGGGGGGCANGSGGNGGAGANGLIVVEF
jgi:hypothetical protein